MLKVTCMMGNRTVVAVQTLKLNCRQQDHYYTLYINFIITIIIILIMHCVVRMFQTNHTIYNNKYLLLTLWHVPVSHQLFYTTLQVCENRLNTVHICYWHVWNICTTPAILHHCTGLWTQAIYNMLQLISVTDMYDMSVLHLYSLAADRPVKTDRMRWVVLRTCNTSVYGSVTGSLHPHPVTDQEIFCCV